jgi:hypothetical protein
MPVAKQYVSTGSRGQDSPTLFFQNSKNKTASYTSAIMETPFPEYSLQTSSIHCSVFGDVLIHDTSSASEGAQALNIYINRLID